MSIVMYSAPRIEDFGRIERRVYSIFSPPNGETPPENTIPPASAPSSGESGGGLFGLFGIAAGVAAAIVARNGDAVEPVAGPLEEEDEAAKANE